MIALTRLNGSEMFLNADLVATVESFHDTVVTLVDGKTYVVRETAEQVVDSIVRYRAHILALARDWAVVPDDTGKERAALYVLPGDAADRGE